MVFFACDLSVIYAKNKPNGVIKLKIGYACIPLAINTKVSRRLMLKNFQREKFENIVRENLKGLKNTLLYNIKHDIKMFRISSDTIPLSSHPVNQIPWWDVFKDEFQELRDIVTTNDIRVSMHPGQYTIINSPDSDIINKSIADLEYHCRFLDLLGAGDEGKMILHVGGIYGDKDAAVKRFKDTYKTLDSGVKRRLVVENDERSYSIKDVIDIGKDIGIPVIFDNLHNECHNDYVEDIEWIFENVKETWAHEGCSMKMHYSQQDPSKRKGAHSTTIKVQKFKEFYHRAAPFSVDMMLEVKDKNLSAIKCINYLKSLDNNDPVSKLTDEWAKYKYAVMERNYKLYKECSLIVNEDRSFKRFYEFIDEFITDTPSPESFKVGAEHVWGYFKNCAKEREKAHFFNLMSKGNTENVKNYLYKLSERYNVDYLLKSYYFIY